MAMRRQRSAGRHGQGAVRAGRRLTTMPRVVVGRQRREGGAVLSSDDGTRHWASGTRDADAAGT